MNFKQITIKDENGKTKKISSIKDFVKYRGGDTSLIVPKRSAKRKKIMKDSNGQNSSSTN
jgi:hypothetical protein